VGLNALEVELGAIWFGIKKEGFPATPGQCGTESLLAHTMLSPGWTFGSGFGLKFAFGGLVTFGLILMSH